MFPSKVKEKLRLTQDNQSGLNYFYGLFITISLVWEIKVSRKQYH